MKSGFRHLGEVRPPGTYSWLPEAMRARYSDWHVLFFWIIQEGWTDLRIVISLPTSDGRKRKRIA